MSSEDINLILKELESSPDKRLRISAGENFLISHNYKSVKIYNPSNNSIGILNNIAASFNDEKLLLSSRNATVVTDESDTGLKRTNPRFRIKRLNNDNYVGCILSEYGKCARFYALTPESFEQDEHLHLDYYDDYEDDSPSHSSHPYYYYLHGLEVSMNHKKIKDLEKKIENLQLRMESVVAMPGPPGPRGLPGQRGKLGPRGLDGLPGIPGEKGEKGQEGGFYAVSELTGKPGPKGDQGHPGLNGLPGEKGDKGAQGRVGPKGDKGDSGPVGPQGVDGAPGVSGEKGDLGLKGDRGEIGAPGMDGLPGLQGFNGTQGEKGAQGRVGPKGNTGAPGPKGSKGEDGVGAAEADQFLRKMNQTKIEIQNAQKAAEVAKTASEKSAKEAQDAEGNVTKLHDKTVNLTKRAETFKNKVVQLQRDTEALHQDTKEFYSKARDIFCKTNPADQICTTRRKKRETKNLNNPVTSGVGRPTSFISQVINFFYPFVKQDEYKIENKTQELNQVAKIIDAADIAIKFEKVSEETASNCGIPKKSLNFNPVKLQSTILDRSLFNDESRNELLKLLYLSAKKSCPNYKQTDRFLATFKDRMERTLENNEQQRGFVNIEKTAPDKEQPRSFMSDITPPSSFKTIDLKAVNCLR
ncbi:collagen-like domain-containing protein [Wolbachia endosymbiont (group A) of Sicus ferrugineus]|uniref:hypothetical protein n=1 Tax=Wolbachia endosymbiont (group A) of Sicus ferrugineus TaxID=2954056 RepID=UPI00222FAA5A|nr:hypothetical protein [Wolbachia endosymbiont (group A) of Sicus ferrugineus]